MIVRGPIRSHLQHGYGVRGRVESSEATTQDDGGLRDCLARHRIASSLPGLDASFERLRPAEPPRLIFRCLTGSRRLRRSGAIKDDLLAFGER